MPADVTVDSPRCSAQSTVPAAQRTVRMSMSDSWPTSFTRPRLWRRVHGTFPDSSAPAQDRDFAPGWEMTETAGSLPYVVAVG
jgi:hypothetical protein